MNGKFMGVTFFISISLIVMFLLMIPRRKRYQVSILKSLIILIYVVLTGLFATRFLYFIENGGWEGMSFFGAVFFLPILIFPLAKLLSLNYSSVTDFIALPGLSMFAVMKCNCYVQDCCGGTVIGYTADGVPIFFPSQLVEVFVTIGIITVLLIIESKGKTIGRLYPLTMIVYGVVRFILNWLRWDNSLRILGMPKGNFWAIVSTIIGVVWVSFFSRSKISLKNNFQKIKED